MFGLDFYLSHHAIVSLVMVKKNSCVFVNLDCRGVF